MKKQEKRCIFSFQIKRKKNFNKKVSQLEQKEIQKSKTA
jgi:hypothetical protein